MQTEQLTLELINNNENLQDLEQVESEVDNVENLLYKNKLRKIIDDISRCRSDGNLCLVVHKQRF